MDLGVTRAQSPTWSGKRRRSPLDLAWRLRQLRKSATIFAATIATRTGGDGGPGMATMRRLRRAGPSARAVERDPLPALPRMTGSRERGSPKSCASSQPDAHHGSERYQYRAAVSGDGGAWFAIAEPASRYPWPSPACSRSASAFRLRSSTGGYRIWTDRSRRATLGITFDRFRRVRTPAKISES